MTHNGTMRNWVVVGLTERNTVIIHTDGDKKPHDSNEKPSEFWGLGYLTRRENAILRRGMTATHRDRQHPRPEQRRTA